MSKDEDERELQSVTNHDFRLAVTLLIHWMSVDLTGCQVVMKEADENDRMVPLTMALLRTIRHLCPELAGDDNLAVLRDLAVKIAAAEDKD